jgi:hypothetical protein
MILDVSKEEDTLKGLQGQQSGARWRTGRDRIPGRPGAFSPRACPVDLPGDCSRCGREGRAPRNRGLPAKAEKA